MLGKGVGVRSRYRNGTIPAAKLQGLAPVYPVPATPLVILFPHFRLVSRSSRWFARIVNELEAEPVEVCKPAIPAPDRKIPAPDSYIMGAFHPALPA